ncbi:MAG: sodium:proton antiporter [Dokdonella sp.]|uniref:cation:proton antiporter n=1 Tax=Dokdonella sp. TaxID=2291710 RepID=UPI0032676C01
MNEIAAILIAVTAACAWINERWLKLPMAVGIFALSLLVSVTMLGAIHVGFGALPDAAAKQLASIDFSVLLLQGMLSFLLFAGALHVDAHALRSFRWQVGFLALVGTLATAFIIGIATYFSLRWAGFELSLPMSLVFGALIAPTDPVAVIGALKSAKAPHELETTIAAESLFNDGVGVVLFAIFSELALNGTTPSPVSLSVFAVREVVGGLALGGAVGAIAFYALRAVDNYEVEILVTLAAVMGGYALATPLGVSGPLAMVIVGLIVGNKGRELAMSQQTRVELDRFWALVDTVLNSLLFVLIGLEALVMDLPLRAIPIALAVVVLSLAARSLTVGLPVALLPRWFRLPKGSSKVLVWAGLRGGISVALALSLPKSPERDLVVLLTYTVVLFSVLMQGLTIGRLTRRWLGNACGPADVNEPTGNA